MTSLSMLIFAVVTMIAVSYGWGMRGDLIGGEEGAMLPGALLGLCISQFIGSQLLADNFFVFMALGMMGMFFGGTEPYAQCFEFSYWGDRREPGPENMKKAMLGLCIKGAPWFGICAAVIGIGFSAMTGLYYKWYEIAVLFAALPIMRIAGTRIFNYPLDIKKKIFPKIYFSKTSQEEWGGLWFMMITMVAFILFHKDYFALTVLLLGMLGGSVGWMVTQLMHSATKARMKNGKYFFGKWQENGRIDNWKIMEFGYGAIGGLSIALGFILQHTTVAKYVSVIEMNGGIWSPLSDIFGHDFSKIVPVVWFVLVAFDMLSHVISAPGVIREKSLYSRYKKITEFCHRPILSYIPIVCVMLGSIKTAQLAAIVVLFWQAAEEFCFVQLENSKKKKTVPVLLSYLLTAALAVWVWIGPSGLNPLNVFILISVEYILLSSLANIYSAEYTLGLVSKNKVKFSEALKSMKCFPSVKVYYIVCVTLTTILLKL